MTREYAALEQLMNEPSTPRSDEWALGIMFYKLCTNNKHPFKMKGEDADRI
jgi:serine/threonine protein kinase